MEILKQRINKTDNVCHNTKSNNKNHEINNINFLSSESCERNYISNSNEAFNENNKNINKNIIKFTKNSKSFEKMDLITKLSLILENENITKTEKIRTKNIFQNFVYYLNTNNSINKKTKSIFSKNLIYTKRIKISDVDKFIDDKYKQSTDLTIHTMKIKMRKYVRLVNNEPKLNFQKKQNKIIHISHSEDNKSKDIKIIIKYLSSKSNLLNILLFYFLYYVGLNYSLVSRLMIKNFKQAFKVLLIQKGTKIIKHFFPKQIINVLFYYFMESRSFESKYFFHDDVREQKNQSRTQFIKNEVKLFLDEIPDIKEKNKQKLLSEFSRLRKSKRLTKIGYCLFEQTFTKENDILKINEKNKNYCKFEDESDYIFNKNEECLNNINSLDNIKIKDDISSINYDGDIENSNDLNTSKLMNKGGKSNHLKKKFLESDYEYKNTTLFNNYEEDNSNSLLSLISNSF